MNVQEINIDKVIPYWHNPRNNDKTVERLMKSIREYGFNQPLVVNKDMVLIVGHARLKAARKLGLTTVPCVIVDLTDEQAKKYRIADNKIQELTDWKEDDLFKELREIGDQFELLDMGFDMGEIKDIVGAFDEVVEQGQQSAAEVQGVVTAATPWKDESQPVTTAQPVETVETTTVYAEAPAVAVDTSAERAKLEAELKKREAELNGRFVKESYEQHSKDNLIVCPHCGKSFKVRGLT